MSDSSRKVEIRHRCSGSVLFAAEVGSLRSAVEAAVKAGACLTEANLTEANLAEAELAGADLTWANLAEANLTRAYLAGADLAWANLIEANLTGARLAGASLTGAHLPGANLAWVNLAKANLTGANLTGANLTGANLAGANLTGADLTGANLTRTNVTWANLTRVKGINSLRTTPLLMLHDQPGAIRAYKLVKSNGEGPYNGGITYVIGKKYEVDDANSDVSVSCAAGINLATLDWCMREWRDGYRILVAEFTAKDIAAIPTATDGKFRVHRCRIVGEKDLTEIGLTQEEDR